MKFVLSVLTGLGIIAAALGLMRLTTTQRDLNTEFCYLFWVFVVFGTICTIYHVCRKT